MQYTAFTNNSRAARADGRQADEGRGRLLLEFMGALERGLFTAHSGSSLRARVPDEAATFFVQNRKVRSWMSEVDNRHRGLQPACVADHVTTVSCGHTG